MRGYQKGDEVKDLPIKVERNVPLIPDRSCDWPARVDRRWKDHHLSGRDSIGRLILQQNASMNQLHTKGRSKPMAEYLRFSTNIAVEVALRPQKASRCNRNSKAVPTR